MEELNEYLAKAGPDGLVVVNYSTSWCGPCKAIAPRFAAMSDEFTTVAFLKARAAYHFARGVELGGAYLLHRSRLFSFKMSGTSFSTDGFSSSVDGWNSVYNF